MRLKFKATKFFPAFKSIHGEFHDGEIKEVDDGIGRQLIHDYEDNFEVVKGKESVVATAPDKALKDDVGQTKNITEGIESESKKSKPKKGK